jgi:hypothetical protein
MNRYMLILWGGDARIAKMSPDQIQDHMKHWTTWMDGLAKQGVLDGGEPLGSEARLVKGAKKPVTDGPYTEAKEAVTGYVILKADSMDKACEITKGCPLFEIDGTVEVRPIRAM